MKARRTLTALDKDRKMCNLTRAKENLGKQLTEVEGKNKNKLTRRNGIVTVARSLSHQPLEEGDETESPISAR